MTYDPRMLSVDRWTALTNDLLVPFGFAPKTVTQDDWRDWATAAVAIPAIAAVQVPDPRLYQNWVDWAHRLNEGLRLLGS